MRLGITLIFVGVVAFAFGGTALAGPPIDWDPLFVYSIGSPPATFDNQPAGQEIQGVGLVSTFGPPIDFLNSTMPATEYSIFIHGLISLGTSSITSSGFTFYTTNYSGGSIEIYQDTSPDAVFDPFPPNANVPSTFTDGVPILTGTFTSFVIQTNNFTAHDTGNMEWSITWTGGTLFSYTFSPSGQPCPGLLTGGITWDPSPGVLIPGYLFRNDGKIDFNCPTATKQSTWGQVKGIYR
jgi:hypothetical protein